MSSMQSMQTGAVPSADATRALAMILSFIGMAIYISNSAAIPMLVLSEKYAAAGTEVERAMFAAAGEAVLARGEDFTPGAFIGLISGGSRLLQCLSSCFAAGSLGRQRRGLA